MMKREKDIRKPKTGYKLYIAQCGECKNKSLIELRKSRKTIKKPCSKCNVVNRHKIIGKIKNVSKRYNMMRIKYYSQLQEPQTELIDTSKIEIAKFGFIEQMLLLGESSYYNWKHDIIGIKYHKWLNLSDAWNVLIDDVNHESEHQILFHFINKETSRKLDNIAELLREYLLIGFKNIEKLNHTRNLFGQQRTTERVKLEVC